jgi:uncharacterized protein (DUF362 family)
MKDFVNIKTVYNSETERTVSRLASVYDSSKVASTIEQLLSEWGEATSLNGKKILVKPNWVKHNSAAAPQDDICLRTHDKFLVAVLKSLVKYKPKSIVVGDAPIQGCKWKLIITDELIQLIKNISDDSGTPIIIKDFRRVVFDAKANEVVDERSGMENFLVFDLGKASYLEPISEADRNPFRVSQYDADKFKNTHKPGMHKYCITRELFESDVVISLPKIKTHQKSGITGSLKNIVGLNGDKDYLPHHRIGGQEMGGDSYSGKNMLRYLSELVLDNANRNKGKWSYRYWRKFASLLWKISLPGPEHQLSAAWFGNDTTWRMVMDLNKIVLYGKADGKISDRPQRSLYSLSDGVVGGQGDGPLKPEPLNLGIVSFTDDSAIADIAHATLMGLNIERIPLLRAAKNFQADRNSKIIFNGEQIELHALKQHAVNAQVPPGWINYQK